MHVHAFSKALTVAIILVILFPLSIMAQEQRRIQPAFPISAGEKMLVIPGAVFGTQAVISYSLVTGTTMEKNFYHIDLPVGTTLKRMVADLSDNDGTNASYIHVQLIRMNNTDSQLIGMRSITTNGYNSANFAQFVGNPLSHAMLQGWTYYVRIVYIGGGKTTHKVGDIKIIYEP